MGVEKMSGHNKWSTIKRKKGANDAARAKVFTKIGRELAVAVKNGGPDPNNKAKLRLRGIWPKRYRSSS